MKNSKVSKVSKKETLKTFLRTENVSLDLDIANPAVVVPCIIAAVAGFLGLAYIFKRGQ